MGQKGHALLVIVLIVAAIAGFFVFKKQLNLSFNQSINETSDNSPEKVTENFYNWYIDCLDKTIGKSDPKQCDYKTSPYVSEELIQSLTKIDEDFTNSCSEAAKSLGGCSHGNLIICAQDLPKLGNVDRAQISGKNAETTVHTLFESSGDSEIKVKLTKVDNLWKISQISCLGGQDFTEEDTNWKTYKDPKNRFEFKYPSEFKEFKSGEIVIFNKSGAAEKVQTGSLTLKEFNDSFDKYSIETDFSQSKHQYDLIKKQWLYNGSSSEYSPKKAEGDLEAYILKEGGGMCQADRIIIPSPNYVKVVEIINIVCDDKSLDKNLKDQITKNILSTFKFQ